MWGGAFLFKIDLRRVAKCGKLIVDNKTKSKKVGLTVTYKLGSLFSGVGGLALGFVDVGFDLVYANDNDKVVNQTFGANFDLEVDERSVDLVEDMPDITILTASYPCQPLNPNQREGSLFYETLRLIEANRPRVVLIESVRTLVSHQGGETFRIMCEAFDDLGYYYTYQVLNAKDFGNLPQNRERLYFVAFDKAEDYANFKWPLPVPLTKKLDKVLDFDGEVDARYYYTLENCNFFNVLNEQMTNPKSIYQWRRSYVRENKSGVSPSLVANMGTGGHNVPLIRTSDGRIRKLTPKECFDLQGFPKGFALPDLADYHLYKQAGNTVAVPVVSRIAKNIWLALSRVDCGLGSITNSCLKHKN